MKKILLITHNYQYAGAQLVLYQLAKGLVDRGNTVGVYGYGKGPLQADYQKAGIFAFGGDDKCCIPSMEWFGPEVVIGNTLLSHWAVEAARIRGIPTLWWIHEGEWARQQLWQHQMKQALWTSTRNVVSTEYLKRLYEYNLQKTVLIKYGIPATQEPTPKDTKAPVRFLVAGTIEWRKGQDLALDAWEQAKPDGATLTFIGSNWNSAYSQQIAHRSLAIPNVYCQPAVDPGVFAGLLDSFDVLLVPSRDEGGYPQVLLQAQERGKLVIAADVCGMREQVLDYQPTGLLFKDTQELSYYISLAIESYAIRNRHGRGARDWVHKNNSLVEHLDQWQKLIEEVI